MKEIVNKTTLMAWRAGVMAGIGVLIWLGINFVTRNEFEQRWAFHDRQRIETLERLLRETEEVKQSVRRIEGILLNQRAEVREFNTNDLVPFNGGPLILPGPGLTITTPSLAY